MILLVLAGCATTVTIDSLAKPDAEKSLAYRIQAKAGLAGEEAQIFQEAADALKVILAGKGMYEAPEGTGADLAIILEYGVSGPQHRVESYSDERSRIRNRTIIVYEKRLKISAHSTAAVPGRPPSEVWTVDATSRDEGNRIRENLPVLIAATSDFIGRDSQGQRIREIFPDGPEVAYIRKNTASPAQP